MKIKTALCAVTIAAVSVSSMAVPVEYLKKVDGTESLILKKNVVVSEYVSGNTLGSDGKYVIEKSEYFVGSILVKNTDRKCSFITLELLELKTVQVGDAAIQVPKIHTTDTSVPCGE